jgi:hypothetical protein
MVKLPSERGIICMLQISEEMGKAGKNKGLP